MAVEIVMPQLGMTMTEGTVVKWLKKVGDQVRKGDAVFEVETDKVTQDVESLDEGMLGKIVVGEGVAVPVGTVIAYLGDVSDAETGRVGDGGSGTVGAPEPRTQNPEPSQPSVLSPQSSAPGTQAGVLRASPAARNLARKLGVDIATLVGTGPSGRIVEEDVRRAAATPAAAPVVAPSPRPAAAPSPVPQAAGERVELKGVRKVVAERMAQSFSTAPHFYLTVEVDATGLVGIRQQVSAAIQRRQGVDVTVTDLLVKAVAVALKEHPEANAAWMGSGYQLNQGVNLGVAVAMQEGLVVPVIQGAERLSLGEVAKRRSVLVERARKGELTLPELEGGSFTLSNLGMFGIDMFQAIVNPPQAAILAVGRIKDRVVAVDGQAAVRPTMFVTLSSDHRIMDGAMAAKFLARVVQLLEDPVELLLGDS